MSAEDTVINTKGKAAVEFANSQQNPLLLLKKPITLICRDDDVEETMQVECIKGQSLKGELHEWVESLLERNLKNMYKATPWGWDLKEKMKEVMEDTAYILIVRSSSGKPIGMSHFRFDMEFDDEVVYCYEVQVEESARGMGIGGFLLDLLCDLTVQFNMRKTMLTVFKKNKRAYKLFKKRGFKVDGISPEEEFYVIMSKPNKSFVE